jgi:hypothetical protein
MRRTNVSVRAIHFILFVMVFPNILYMIVI